MGVYPCMPCDMGRVAWVVESWSCLELDVNRLDVTERSSSLHDDAAGVLLSRDRESWSVHMNREGL